MSRSGVASKHKPLGTCSALRGTFVARLANTGSIGCTSLRAIANSGSQRTRVSSCYGLPEGTALSTELPGIALLRTIAGAERVGAPDTNRTCDLSLRRGLLYPLSYRGVRLFYRTFDSHPGALESFA